MPPIDRPVFPPHVEDIRVHGAIGDDTTDCTDFIAAAIAACERAGGGRVLIPAGKWFTGPIHLHSNIELHLQLGATVRFSDDPQRYLPSVFVRWLGMECFNYSPLIYARDCHNIAITGHGVLLGQGKAWWAWRKAEQATAVKLHEQVRNGRPPEDRQFGTLAQPIRPPLILPINCRNVLLEDFTVAEGGPFWTAQLAYCSDVTVRRLTIMTGNGANCDGVVIDSSRNVVVEDCDLHTGGDGVAIKSGLNEDGWRVARPSENIIVRRIRATQGHAAFTIGSEMSGGVRNVLVHDCQFDGPQNGIRIKTARGRGGVIEDVFIHDVTMRDVKGAAIELTVKTSTLVSPDGPAPALRNFHIRDVSCDRADAAVTMTGTPNTPLQNVTLQNLSISAETGLSCTQGERIRLIDLKLTPRTGPVLSLRDCQDVSIEGVAVFRGMVPLALAPRYAAAADGTPSTQHEGSVLSSAREKNAAIDDVGRVCPTHGSEAPCHGRLPHPSIDALQEAPASSVFLDVRGRQTRNVRLLCGTSDHAVRPAVVLGVDVPRDALVHE